MQSRRQSRTRIRIIRHRNAEKNTEETGKHGEKKRHEREERKTRNKKTQATAQRKGEKNAK